METIGRKTIAHAIRSFIEQDYPWARLLIINRHPTPLLLLNVPESHRLRIEVVNEEDIYVRPRNNGLLSPTGGENSEKVDGTWYNRKRQSVENKKQFYEELNFPHITIKDNEDKTVHIKGYPIKVGDPENMSSPALAEGKLSLDKTLSAALIERIKAWVSERRERAFNENNYEISS